MDDNRANQSPNQHSWLVIFSLIFAGEMIFSLPFHVARFFRPSLLDSFALSHGELGDNFAVYGITAMICYFPGGIIADLFSARRLLTISLLATALGGLYYAQIPSGVGLYVLFGYWGITSVLMFWAGMIKATRDWGGTDSQGKAFGILDGGRGLVAALMSTVAVVIFSQWIGVDGKTNQLKSLQMVIYFYSAVTVVAAFLVWHFIPETSSDSIENKHSFEGVKRIISSSRIWLQALIIICAYSVYKGLDFYGLYAVEVLSMDTLESATFTSAAAYLRPVGAIAAGILADRFSASKVIGWNFLILVFLYGLLSLGWSEAILFNLAMFNLLTSFLAVFALRGIYFALVEESNVGHNVTGTAVGFVSLIGYTPDIFFNSIAGRILDANEGIKGFENYFLFLAAIALTGVLIAFLLHRMNVKLIPINTINNATNNTINNATNSATNLKRD